MNTDILGKSKISWLMEDPRSIKSGKYIYVQEQVIKEQIKK